MGERIGGIAALALALLLAGWLPANGAAAADAASLRVADNGALISRDRAAEIARAETGGRVLRVDLRNGDRPRYRVRVLIDGERVRNVIVDARSGRVRR